MLFPISNSIEYTGAQPEIFQGRGSFVEFGHFNKHLVRYS